MRHPSGIPIEITAATGADAGRRRLRDVGLGGLACESAQPLPPAAMVSVRIPIVFPTFETRARVVCARDAAQATSWGCSLSHPRTPAPHAWSSRSATSRTTATVCAKSKVALEWISK